MVFGRVAVVAALLASVDSLAVHTEVHKRTDSSEDPEPIGVPSNARMEVDWGETRLGAPMLESEACSVAYNFSFKSEWKIEAGGMPQHLTNRQPKFYHEPGPGASRVMYPNTNFSSMAYQFFMPAHHSMNTLSPYPVVIVLHSHPARNFSLMNTEGLPRILKRNQSTSFDNRSCWCLDMALAACTIANETTDLTSHDPIVTVDLQCPMADCDFPDNFPALVIMPQGWAGTQTPTGWTSAHYDEIIDLTRDIASRYNGNMDNVVVIGSAEGGEGAFEFASLHPELISGVGIFDAPSIGSTTIDTTPLEGKLVWVTGDSAAGTAGNDALVTALKNRAAGITRYYRYVEGPMAADPGFAGGYGHTYDMITRDLDGFWASMWHNKQAMTGRAAWGLGPYPYIHLGPQPFTTR